MSVSSRPLINLVVAMARNGVIGRDNGLIWRLGSDLRRFKALTMGKPLLMGRKTYESIGRPLPGRRIIVLTRDQSLSIADVNVVLDWEGAIAAAGDAEELMVAGGGEIYALALPHADRIYMTEVDISPEGDTVFPSFDRGAFHETSRVAHPSGDRDECAFAFVDMERVR